MEKSLMIAQFWGIYLVVFCILLLVKPKLLDQFFSFSEKKDNVISVSFVAIVLGIANIVLHNIWVADWRVIITLFGWIALLKGCTMLLSADKGYYLIKVFKKPVAQIWLVAMLVLGFFLLYKGFEYTFI